MANWSCYASRVSAIGRKRTFDRLSQGFLAGQVATRPCLRLVQCLTRVASLLVGGKTYPSPLAPNSVQLLPNALR